MGLVNIGRYKSVAIMGGTFDPIHYGHLVTAEAVRHEFDADRVLFVPTGLVPHKDTKYVSGSERRYSMAVLATVNNPFFDVSRIEIDRRGMTYTIDTILQLKNVAPDTRLLFITGADAMHQILTWKDADKLLNICEFVAVSRPGYDADRLYKEIDCIRDSHQTKIHFMEVPALAISSTDIRARVAAGRPIKYLLPQAVENYIYKCGLYTQKQAVDQEADSDSLSVRLESSEYDARGKSTVSGQGIALEHSEIKRKLQSALSIARYKHSLGVCGEAIKLGEIYGADTESVITAALLHDCAKDYPDDLKKRLCKEYHIPLDSVTKKNIDLVHAFLGAEVAKREYNVTSEDILNAIRYHTTGRPGMSMLEKIIYIADYLDPGRNIKNKESMERLRHLSVKDIDEAIAFAISLSVEHVRKTGKPLHPLSLDSLEYYRKKRKLK